MTLLLSTKALSKSFDGLDAVRDIDFELPIGQVRALIGPNGAGKTTFVSLICGRIAPTAGTVTFDGQDITHLPAHRRIQMGMAYTFQITSIFPGLSVRENVALAARRYLKGADVVLKIESALDKIGLLDRVEQLAGDLAYGHQRLLEIAMGLAQSPRLLILDEPTQGLSDGEISDFKTLIRDLSQQATILLIEHNMNVVMAAADQISVLEAGQMLAEGTPEEIQNNLAVQTAYLGRTDA
ncbi:ABC transporter ATP-binding protein [Roseovarius sp. EL26]|uniref:ABC transporter ATP-binding protein n=1 Tax=Roseovarius sp. EL26 TaxID=2126672 RepID=UPI0015752DD4|nr:ABC transporter ATP-binding protein [Roseovarius sp. EL26]